MTALPSTFSAPGRALAFITSDTNDVLSVDTQQMTEAFLIGGDRKFEEDPRFGLVVLSEIAGRALSPAVNDPGTAMYITGVFVRLFAQWSKPVADSDSKTCEYDRVAVLELSVDDMFDDAFTAIARDGAGAVEVVGRLQKGLASLAFLENEAMHEAALRHSRMALARAESALQLSEDLQVVRSLASFSSDT